MTLHTLERIAQRFLSRDIDTDLLRTQPLRMLGEEGKNLLALWTGLSAPFARGRGLSNQAMA